MADALPRPRTLDESSLAEAVHALAAVDPDLAGIVARHGQPPLWGREPGFETLAHIVLEQQVSLASGAAALARLRAATGEVSPAAVVAAGEARLLAAGLTRQKTRYLLGLADAVLTGRLDLDDLALADDGAVRARLTALLGIGDWTADVYLVMALRRPDVWPVGDLALAAAMRRAKGLPALPRREEQLGLAAAWRPWRAAAARILWHAYLSGER